MLLRFRVANVLSFREEQALTFVATEMNDGSARPAGVRERGKELAVVPVLGVFGANASGKTNVVNALRLMRSTVLDSVESMKREPSPLQRPGPARLPFALDPTRTVEPSFFEVDIVLHDGVRYTYGFEIDDQRVCAEWLHAYPKGRKQVWFERDDERFEFPGEGLRGEKTELARRTRFDVLFLSIAAQFNHEQLMPIFEWFRSNLWLVGPEARERETWMRTTLQRLTDDVDFRERVTRLLEAADIGVSGIDIAWDSGNQVRLLHKSGTHAMPLALELESMGTRSWLAMLGPMLLAFDQGATILVDELDASLHTAICAEIIAMFEDAEVNPGLAQMLFTTHDAMLLRTLPGGDRLLDRDAIWLTEKGSDGATELYPLTSLNPPPRKDANLERGYLLGRYGARPRISHGEFALLADAG